VIIHGLFGGKRNWQSIAKAICRAGQQVSVKNIYTIQLLIICVIVFAITLRMMSREITVTFISFSVALIPQFPLTFFTSSGVAVL